MLHLFDDAFGGPPLNVPQGRFCVSKTSGKPLIQIAE
jgi:hypothetical protein